MTEPQPEYVWAFPDEKPARSRMWLVVGLVVAAIVVAAAVFLAFLRPWETRQPTASASPTNSSSPSPTASAAPSATPTPSPTSSASPSPVPTATPPAPSDPALPVFRGKVQPLLDDAATGLTYAQDATGEEGVQIADQLREDAGRLSDTVAPQSIASQWGARVQDYGRALDALRTAFAQGGSTGAALTGARSALRELNDLVAG